MRAHALLVTALAAGLIDPPQQSYTIVLLPDTQFYSFKDPGTYVEQMQWIKNQRDALNIQFVIHLGDVTDKNTLPEWMSASAAQSILDETGVHYSMTTGNHDYPSVDGDYRRRDASYFHAFFHPSRFPWYGGHFRGSENNYTLFNLGDLPFMALSLEYAPPKDAMCWADKIIRDHPERRTIVATHCYQGEKGGHVGNCDIDKDRNMVGANGEAIWQELIRWHPNIFLVVSGHINDSEYRRRDRETGGNASDTTKDAVHEILTDYQVQPGRNGYKDKTGSAAVVMRVMPDHGNGWLRTLRFDPSKDSVYVRTISVLGASEFFWTRDTGETVDRYSANSAAVDHAFEFSYDMHKAPPARVLNPHTADRLRFHDRAVNSRSSGNQRAPRISTDGDGNWVAVWEDDRDDNDVYQIYARRFDARGCETVHDFTVNTVSSGQQRKPAVAMAADGRFVVVWEDDAGGNGYYEIKARGFNSDGSQRFAVRTVNASSSGQQLKPAVAMDGAGNFVVVWEDDTDDNGVYQIRARGFDAMGNPVLSERTVNATSAGQQRRPTIAMRPSGDFVVVWEDDAGSNGYYQIKARGYRKDGTQRFSQRTVNTPPDGQQLKPAVFMEPNGRFVVAWEDDAGGNGYWQIKMRGFTSAGVERFGQKTVNTTSSGQQRKPSIAGSAEGFVVTWEDDTGDDGKYQIKARGFKTDGSVVMGQLTVNRDKEGQQLVPAAAMGPSGRFIVVWQDDIENNGIWEVLGRGCTLTAKCDWP